MRSATLFLVISVFAGALGQLMMKAGLIELGPLRQLAEDIQSLLSMPALSGIAWIAAGVVAYCVAVLLWIRVLKVYPLSVAYPLLSLGYIVVYLGSAWWPAINESLSMEKTLGVLFIIIGVTIVTHFSEEKPERE